MGCIDNLADETISHVLSFLPIKEAALTSVLSKRWRNLFAYRPNLHFDDQEVGRGEDFIDFVDRVLALSGNFHRRKISIKCRNSINDTGLVTWWMTDVLKNGVLNLDIDIIADDTVLVPLEIFNCKTLAELKLAKGFDAMLPEDVSLPSLKTLYLDSIYFYNSHYCVLEKLLSACPVLEELSIRGDSWQNRKCCRTVSSTTLKKLTIKRIERFDFWDVSFDTPSLTYLEYSDLVPRNYPVVNFQSLVEAKLDLTLYVGDSNPTNLIKGLRNVEVLELSTVDTWKVFSYFPEAIPVFSNLICLSITIDWPHYDWKFLPMLANKSPNLETLVIKGPLNTDRYGREYGLSSPVKVLKITEYGGKIGELKQMKYFLEKLSCLELVKVCAYAVNEKEKFRITRDLLMLPRSSNCNMEIEICEKAIPILS